MNKQKFLQIADLIENSPKESFHMGAWFGELMTAGESGDYEDFQDLLEEDDEIVEPLNVSSIHSLLDTVEIDGVKTETLHLSCGTTACIAGWTIANEYFYNKDNYISTHGEELRAHCIQSIAANILDINAHQAQRLFYCDEDSIWSQIATEYDYTFDPEFPQTWNIHPKKVADVLRRIASGDLELKDEYWNKDYED